MKSNKRKLIPGIVIFLFGLIATIIATLFKILHWPYGPEILTISALIEIIGIVMTRKLVAS